MGLAVDLKCRGDENRGIYFEETKRCLIYLPMHETLEEIYKTIAHEAIHHCFSILGEDTNMDEEMEESLIFNIQWADVAI